jgi:hypothetical protein
MVVNAKLSDMECSALSGARCGALTLPAMEITGSASGLPLTLSKDLPGLKITATGLAPNTGSLSKDLPPLAVTVSVQVAGTGTLSKSIAPLKISATGSSVGSGTLNRTLSDLGIEAEAHCDTMAVDAYLSALIMASLATGGVIGAEAILMNESRFTDYVLRHAR